MCRSLPARSLRSACSFEPADARASDDGRSDRVEPMTHDQRGLLGLGEVDGMAPAGDQGRNAVRHEAGHPQRLRGEANVVRPRQGQDGAGECRKAIPQRFLGARPAQSQGGGQPGRAVAETLRALRRALQLEPLEERPAQPRVDEPLDVPRGFERISQVLVGAAPTCPFGRVLNACGDPDEDGMASTADRRRVPHAAPPGHRANSRGGHTAHRQPVPARPPPPAQLSPGGRRAPNRSLRVPADPPRPACATRP